MPVAPDLIPNEVGKKTDAFRDWYLRWINVLLPAMFAFIVVRDIAKDEVTALTYFLVAVGVMNLAFFFWKKRVLKK
jgi:hypothetical protein